MRSGSLRHVVTLQSPVYRVNAAGDNEVASWLDFASVRAAVRHVTAREADRFARLQMTVTHNVTLRWMPGITGIMRLLWQGKVLSITEIGLDPTARETINLKCTELMPDSYIDPGSSSGSASASGSASSSASESEDEK